MGAVTALAGVALIFLVLLEGFEVMVLPRRVSRRIRFTRFFYRAGWTVWRAVALRVSAGAWREALLSRFGPLSMLLLFGSWVTGLIFGFALLQWSLEMPLQAPETSRGLLTYVYHSGTTFFTLGYGDITPLSTTGRALAVAESGLGFGFLAVIIGYLPVLYQAFSRREVSISLLDARAGSPPTAGELLRRIARCPELSAVDPFLAEWERWSAELLESHLSFPVLSYYRSQHDNQSWLAALAAVLDTCAFLITGVEGNDAYQAQLTFAMARHAVVDLALVFRTPPRQPSPERLPGARLEQLRGDLRRAGVPVRDGGAAEAKLAELRALYEPFVAALAEFLLFGLPPFAVEQPAADNWQKSAWLPRAPGIGRLSGTWREDEHFS